jgi:hypothetical protein
MVPTSTKFTRSSMHMVRQPFALMFLLYLLGLHTVPVFLLICATFFYSRLVDVWQDLFHEQVNCWSSWSESCCPRAFSTTITLLGTQTLLGPDSATRISLFLMPNFLIIKWVLHFQFSNFRQAVPRCLQTRQGSAICVHAAQPRKSSLQKLFFSSLNWN